MRAWARRGNIDRNGAPEAWVRVTAWRIAVSRWRRARDGTRLGSLTARPESTAGPTPDRVAFSDALRKVPAEQRRALVLYHLCDMTVDQVAAARCSGSGRTSPRPPTVQRRQHCEATAKGSPPSSARGHPREHCHPRVHRDPAGRSPDHADHDRDRDQPRGGRSYAAGRHRRCPPWPARRRGRSSPACRLPRLRRCRLPDRCRVRHRRRQQPCPVRCA